MALARPDVSNVPALRFLGVRRLLSEVALDSATRSALEQAGIQRIEAPVGSALSAQAVAAALSASAAPGRLAIHCEHGVDRTGATLALILHCTYGVPLGRALAAVVAPYTDDRRALASILADSVPGSETEQNALRSGGPEVGLYSAARNGGIGGMKVRLGTTYEELVRSAIAAGRACR